MKYFALVTYDLKKADADDYECVKEGLLEIGLSSTDEKLGGKGAKLTETTAAGITTGDTLTDAKSKLTKKIKKVLSDCDIKGKFVLVVADKGQSRYAIS